MLPPEEQELAMIIVELSSCGEHANVNMAGGMEKAMDEVVSAAGQRRLHIKNIWPAWLRTLPNGVWTFRLAIFGLSI